MRAGLLREIATFYNVVTEKMPSGNLRKTPVEAFKCKVYRKKISASRSSREVNAHEQFIDQSVILQVRNNKSINDAMQIGYNGYMYKISLVDVQIHDNTVILTLEKLNK